MGKSGTFTLRNHIWVYEKLSRKEWIASCRVREGGQDDVLMVRGNDLAELKTKAHERLKIWLDDTFQDIP